VNAPAARTVTVALLGGGSMTVHCPDWCTGHPEALTPAYPSDFCHEGTDTGLTVDTADGQREVLAAGLVHQPYATGGDSLPYATVTLDGEFVRMSPARIRVLADGLERHAVVLRGFADWAQEIRDAAAEARRPPGIPMHLPPLAPLDGEDS
jgi:hypothetical protein